MVSPGNLPQSIRPETGSPQPRVLNHNPSPWQIRCSAHGDQYQTSTDFKSMWVHCQTHQLGGHSFETGEEDNLLSSSQMVATRSPPGKSEAPGRRQCISPDYPVRKDEVTFFDSILYYFFGLGKSSVWWRFYWRLPYLHDLYCAILSLHFPTIYKKSLPE